jgi:hypothetical protein
LSELVFAAFEALSMAATKGDVARVAKALRATGDADVFALFGEPDPDAPFDHEACAAVAEIAVRAGAGGLVALDLYTEFVRPGWSPFPAPRAEERAAADLERTIRRPSLLS